MPYRCFIHEVQGRDDDPRTSSAQQGGCLHIQGGHHLPASGAKPEPAFQERPNEARGSTPPPQSPCVWTGTGTGQRSLEHRGSCLWWSGHLPVHPFASSQPYLAQARINITVWGVGGIAEGSAPPPPPA